MLKRIFLLLVFFQSFLPASFVGATIIHHFTGTAVEGSSPSGSLILEESFLYGMTTNGGSLNAGVVFKVQVDGSNFQILHSFSGGTGDGAYPRGSLCSVGSYLCGMTSRGGSNGRGIIFKIKKDGTGYSVLRSFRGGAGDGEGPTGSLLADGEILYGMAVYGGSFNDGVLFSINLDGTNYKIIHNFRGVGDEGKQPQGSLILNASTLFGMTTYGGAYGRGVVFRINTDGSSYLNLHEFTGEADDGGSPEGSLVLSDSVLYGMTRYGGDADKGVIFKLSVNNGDYEILHEFGEGTDGAYPMGSLCLSGSTLYGMSSSGGEFGKGIIFRIKTTGSGYEKLHEFRGSSSDGSRPYDSLISIGSLVMGMTHDGGLGNKGVVFAYSLMSYCVPHFMADGNVYTALALRNSSKTDAMKVTINYFSNAGSLVQMQAVSPSVPARGQWTSILSPDAAAEGWIEINADQDLTGLCWIGSLDGVDLWPVTMADVPVVRDLSTELIIPHVAQNDNWDTTIYVCNPNDGIANIALSYYDASGVALHSWVFALSKRGSGVYPLKNLLPAGESYSNGSIEITATKSVAAFALYYDTERRGGSCFAGITAVEPRR
ncbi:MAG: hypothetical protein JW884_11135 [Deltaproteobacteria bacterium]|nr:hypothetical protein [Deltaproteobacteria bacterium]